jgi:hypothetical protein
MKQPIIALAIALAFATPASICDTKTREERMFLIIIVCLASTPNCSATQAGVLFKRVPETACWNDEAKQFYVHQLLEEESETDKIIAKIGCAYVK